MHETAEGTGRAGVRVPFFRHSLGQEEMESLATVLAGPVLTTGDAVDEFEGEFAAYLGRRHAVAVTSCTAAIQLSLTALGIGPGDEVITTPMTYVATACAIMQAGARPVLVDVEPDTGNLDASRVESAITPRTRAIVPVHLYGHLCDMVALGELAASYGLEIVEDAAHCIEGSRDGVRPGQVGHAACFSFYATKSLACGEGGAVVTDDDDLAKQLRLLRLHGLTANAADRFRDRYRHYDMVTFGWKYNMDNVHAALLTPQLPRLDERHAARVWLAQRYFEALADVPGVSWPATRPGTDHARHLLPIWVGERDDVLDALINAGVEVVVNYRPIHLLSHLARTLDYRPGDFPVAERIGESTISLPLYPAMPPGDVEVVTAAVASAVAVAAAEACPSSPSRS